MATSQYWDPARRGRKGVLYLIENTVDGKRYIGQTTHAFTTRYRGGRWWVYTTSPYLKRAAAKHGHGAFRVTILHYGKTLDELNRLEEEYARVLDCYAPNGYNLVQCGANKRQHPDSVAKRSRTIVLNDPRGQDVTVTNIRAFCREHGLDNRAICRVIKGEHASHQGWSLAGVTDKHRRNHGAYTVYSEDGVRHDIVNLSAWCREQGLAWHAMRSMVQGKTAESQGYALSVDAFARQRCRHIVTLVGHGQEVVLSNVKRDCLTLGLHSRYVYRLIAGKLPSYKGWTVKALGSVPMGQ